MRALWKRTGLPQEGAANARVFTLECNDHDAPGETSAELRGWTRTLGKSP